MVHVNIFALETPLKLRSVPRDLRVLTYNLWCENGYDRKGRAMRAARYLRSLDPRRRVVPSRMRDRDQRSTEQRVPAANAIRLLLDTN